MGFLQLRHQYQISHEVRRGTQRASRVVLGTSGPRACGEGEPVIVLESWSGNCKKKETAAGIRATIQ